MNSEMVVDQVTSIPFVILEEKLIIDLALPSNDISIELISLLLLLYISTIPTKTKMIASHCLRIFFKVSKAFNI